MILRLQTEEQLAALQQKLKAKLPSRMVHSTEPLITRGTSLKNASRKPQKRDRRISGYVSEAGVLKSILGYLMLHPRVSWVVRINSGALRYENRFIKFGQPGFPDVIGQTKEGLLIGIEVKASNGRASPEQQAFIDKINKSGGLGCIAKSIDDVKALLA